MASTAASAKVSSIVAGTTGNNVSRSSAVALGSPLTSLTSVDIHGGYVAAGLAMRNLGRGTISLVGIPAGSTVYAAYLLWDVIDSSPDSADAEGTFNKTPITGVSIGIGASPCWPAPSNYAFEATVTNLVIGNGRYDLTTSPAARRTGEDPWLSGSPAPLLEGASLVTIYQNPSSPLTTVQLYGGATESDSGNLLRQAARASRSVAPRVRPLPSSSATVREPVAAAPSTAPHL